MRARKALGQHFLRDKGLLDRIAAASGAMAGEVVLEIGPGQGSLTTALLDTGATVVAIERDARMTAQLTRDHHAASFVLVEGDALELDWPSLVSPWTSQGASWRVVGNIPYYITSPLLDKALTSPMPASITFLVQEEVARRLVAEPGGEDYGALTIGVSAVADVSIAMRVGRGAFVPPPKVDSAVIHLVPRAEPLVPPDRIPDFRRLVVSIFSYRRKRMLRALREARGLVADSAASFLAAAGIDPDLRPEVLDPAAFVRLLGVLDSGD
ncbi:MAG TPA: 16S rRNA (adenine(1518)-N(6)/adenine(1519)-N(6))-dimethyltransferase RsmA [Gemmatimonadales bacterium]|nr:16S rRNA (adenine(1518)-N(6)/adenine(1519)-N(6))-dimethyltransferase RsmA [Gemmatimonadales bacterium]